MSCKRINIGQITGSGKERSTQSMSELLEKILEKKNMNEAYKKVCANKGAGGVDGMELEELDGFIRKNWNSIREQIRGRSYKPQPVRRVEIPKPNASKRKLGIPTVMDRVIQQGNPAGYSTDNQPYVRAAVFRPQLRIPSKQEL